MTLSAAAPPRSDNAAGVLYVVESRGVSPEIGLAHLDMTGAECVVQQFADTATFSTLLREALFLDFDRVPSWRDGGV